MYLEFISVLIRSHSYPAHFLFYSTLLEAPHSMLGSSRKCPACATLEVFGHLVLRTPFACISKCALGYLFVFPVTEEGRWSAIPFLLNYWYFGSFISYSWRHSKENGQKPTVTLRAHRNAGSLGEMIFFPFFPSSGAGWGGGVKAAGLLGMLGGRARLRRVAEVPFWRGCPSGMRQIPRIPCCSQASLLIGWGSGQIPQEQETNLQSPRNAPRDRGVLSAWNSL